MLGAVGDSESLRGLSVPTSSGNGRQQQTPGLEVQYAERPAGDNRGTSSSQPYFAPNPPIVSSSEHPLFIVQPCSNVQLPFVALPYASVAPVSSTSSHGVNKPAKFTKRAAADSTVDPSERKRMLHLHAEQSRRSALKGGFEQLEELLPNLQTTGTKPTNAVVVAKAGEYVRDLKDSVDSKQEDVQELKEEIEELNSKIASYQVNLPESGPSASSNERTMLDQLFKKDVKELTGRHGVNFWVFSKLMEPLFETFKSEVEGVSKDDLTKSAKTWSAKHCNLMSMRPMASTTLVCMATDTPILTDPKEFREYVRRQIEDDEDK